MRLIKDSIWTFIGESSLRASKLVLIIVIVQYCNKSDIGAFNYGLSYAAMFAFFFDYGLMQIAIREAYKKNDVTITYFTSIKLITTIIGVLILLVVLKISELNIELVYFVILSSIYIILNDFSIFISFKYRYFQNFKREGQLRILMAMLQLAIPLFFLLIYKNIYKVYLGLIISTLITLGPLIISIYREKNKKYIRIKKISQYDIKILKDGFSLGVQGLLMGLLFNMDLVILGYFRDLSEIGIYSIVSKIIFGVLIIPIQIIQIPIYSRLNNLKNNDKSNQFDQYWMAIYKITTFIGVVVCFITMLMHGQIFKLFGIDNDDLIAKFILMTYVIVAQIIYLYYPINQYLIINNKERFTIFPLLSGLLVLITLAIIILKNEKYEYLTVGVVISQLIVLTLYGYLIYSIKSTMKMIKLNWILISLSLVTIFSWCIYHDSFILLMLILILLIIIFGNKFINELKKSYQTLILYDEKN